MLKKVADAQDVVTASCNDAVMLSTKSVTGLYPASSEVEMRIRECSCEVESLVLPVYNWPSPAHLRCCQQLSCDAKVRWA